MRTIAAFLILITTVSAILYECTAPIEPGPCKGFLIRYGYDKAAEKCTRFAYGGCAGNSNNFKSREDCEKICINGKNPAIRPILPRYVTYEDLPAGTISADPRCMLPVISGRCTSYEPRYGFDMRTGRCIFFMYGGCGGNGNSFGTRDECEQTCAPNTNSPYS